MKIIRSLSYRYLKNNKRKWIVIVLGIVLATTLLYSVSLGASTIRGNNIRREIESNGDHHAIFKNIDYDSYTKLENNNMIVDIISMQDINLINSNQLDNYNNEDNFILTVKSLNDGFGEYFILKEGRYPENNREIIISNNLEYTINYSIGDNIFGYNIVGIYNDNKLGIDEYDIDHIANTKTFNPVVLTKNKVIKNINGDYVVTFKNSFNMYGQIYKVADDLGLTYIVNEYDTRIYNKMEENGGLLQALGQYPNVKTQIGSYSVVIVILLVISMFCIMTIKNAFSISLSERKKYFGTLRSVGATKKQIFKMVLFETFLLSLISVPIGIILGYGFTNFVIYVVNSITQDIIVDDYNIIIYPIYLVISFIFIVITILFSSLKPAKKSSEISPIEIIRESKVYNVMKTKENYPFIKNIFGREGELAYKTIKRNNSKFSVTTNSLIVSVILFITLSVFTDFLLANTVYDSSSDYDITIQIYNSKEQNDIVNRIKEINGIDEIVIKKSAPLRYKRDSSALTQEANQKNEVSAYSQIEIIGLDQDNYNSLLKKIKLKEDKIILYNVITKYNELTNSYSNYNWFNNELKEIEICSVNEDWVNNIFTENSCYYSYDNFYVINDSILEDSYSPMIILPMDEFDEFINNYYKKYEDNGIFDYIQMIDIGINSDKYKLIDEEMNKIFDDYSALNLENSYNNYILDNYEEYTRVKAIKFVINFSMIFIVVISLTSIINTISTNLALRETEFSVLRSLGLSKKGLNKMLSLESLFLGIKTIVYGIPSATFFVVLEMYFAYLMSRTRFDFPYDAYIVSIIAIFIVVFIMNIYSSSKIKNKNIIDSIRKSSI